MGKESRWGKRYRTSLKVRFGLEQLVDTGYVHDVSMFGFFIMTTKLYPDGSVLKIQILTPEKEHINLEGIVRWSVTRREDVRWLIKDSGMGMKIRRFLAGEQHYENICQRLCQRKAQKDQERESAEKTSRERGKNGVWSRFFI